jgi:hypothetical protein
VFGDDEDGHGSVTSFPRKRESQVFGANAAGSPLPAGMIS